MIIIGNLSLGRPYPIRVQSMTNTDTNDIKSTISQSIRLVEAGCEMVRITAQGITEARNLGLIKKGLEKRGFHVPLIADIHFNPGAAEVAAAIVEKVRINPGNYSDKRLAANSISAKEYDEELERIAERLRPLLKICQQHNTAIRIGTNHGSLSSRIMERYGDTVEGMVESAMEFGRICRSENFHNVVFSMKSSNVKVMVQSTRLLVRTMKAGGMDFPIHLGVTEAGDGEDGIIKSAAGIGTLLEEGIGDTIRVSLTGAPEKEIPVALAIVERYNALRAIYNVIDITSQSQLKPRNETIAVSGIGGKNPVGVLVDKEGEHCLVDENLNTINILPENKLPLVTIVEGDAKSMKAQINEPHIDVSKPIIFKNNYQTNDLLRFHVDSAIDFGSCLIDGFGEAIWPMATAIPPEVVNRTAFAILQATRARITRTEFISCPSCGRTQFDIENTLQQVKSATGHLKGLKIAVMGCIVNGPGEMADANYGYVGAGPGKVTIYKARNIAYKNIAEAEAITMLLQLIRDSGDWKEAD